jgi:hypothetical protein
MRKYFFFPTTNIELMGKIINPINLKIFLINLFRGIVSKALKEARR